MKEPSKRSDMIDKPASENSFFKSVVRFGDMPTRLRTIVTAVLFVQMTMMTAFTVQSVAKKAPLKAHRGDGRAGVLLSVPQRITPSNASEGVATNLGVAETSSLMSAGYRKLVSTDSIPWLQTNGPYGGVIRALAVNSSGYVFAGTYGGGVYRSTDNGNSWAQVGLTNAYVYSLAVNSAGYIFAGTEGEGIYRSTDNGNNWTQVGLSSSVVYSLAISPSGYIFAGIDSAIYRSVDNGNDWTEVGSLNSVVFSLAINSSGYIFAGTLSAGIYLSTNNGSSWTAVNSGLTNSEVLSLAINSYGYIFAGTYGGGVFLSVNNGSSWAPVNTGLTNSYVQSLAINSSGYIFVGTNGGAVYLSASNGSGWTQINTGLTNDDVWSLAINLYGYIFAGTWGEGVYVSTNNGSSWTQTNAGFTGSEIWSLAVNSSDNVFAGAIGGGVYRSTDSGNSWTQSSLIENTVQALAINSAGYIFAGTSGDGVYLSTDNGNSWAQVNTGLTNSYVQSLAINSSGYIFAGTDSGVYLSETNGTSWANIGLPNIAIQSLAINSAGYIFAGTAGAGGAVYLSTDGGTTWSQVGSLTSDIYSMAISSTGSIFAGTWGSGVYVSTNSGSSWTAVNNGLANSHVQGLAINSSGYIFAGTWLGGVYESTNNGTSWTQIGLSSDDIQSLALNSSDYLFAGSIGGGVYRTSNSTVVTPSSGGTWTTKTSLPVAETWMGATSVGGILYVAGGSNSSGPASSAYKYDPGTNSWSSIASLPETIYQGDGLCQIGGKLYLPGGWNGSLPTSTLFIYDTSSNTWTKGASMPALSGDGASGVINGLLYVTDPEDGYSGYYNFLFVYNPASNSWTALPNSADAHAQPAYGVINGKLYIAGGINGNSTPGSGLEVYDPVTNTWTMKASMPIAGAGFGSGVINGKLYVVGGSNASGTAIDSVFIYDPSSDTWSSGPPMPTARSGMGVAVINNTLYAVGGSSVSGVLTTVEAFTPAGATAGPPTISSFSPTSGPIGTTVKITGTNFSSTVTNNVVYFGAVKATVNAATSTSLTVMVPVGTTYQPISVTVNGLTAYSSAPFNVTFPSSQIIDVTSFASKLDFTTGTNPYSVAIGDIDGDGKPDLIVTNYSSNTVSVFRNTSTSGSITASSFASRVDFTTGTNPWEVVVCDVDGDGKPDLIITNRGSSTVSVFRNTSTPGNISFAAKVDIATLANPYYLAMGDVDGDGKPDLVVGNDLSTTVSVFRNTSTSGSISFASSVNLTAESYPNGIALGDLDGDGKPDIAVANYLTSTVSVLRNTSTSGSISFAAKVDFSTGSYPTDIAIGDVDGDGKPDLIVINNGSSTVSVFRNTSTSGTITTNSFASRVDFTVANSAYHFAIGDLDGDGKPDLVVPSGNSQSVSVLRNTSTSGSITASSFASQVNFTTGVSPIGVAIGDLDGDGKPDLVIANTSSNTVSILRNTISGSLSAPVLATPANGSTGVSTSPTLSWNASTGAASYRLQVSTDSTFATTTYDTSGLTATSKSISGLSSQTKYYWRVNASNVSGTSVWSTVWSFTTANQFSLSWTQINNGLTNNYVQSLAINSLGYIFAGTYGSGVYLSKDSGASWAQVGLTSSEVYSFAINSLGYIFAGVGYFNLGAYLSTDNGTSWTPIGLTSSNVAALAINSSGTIFAGTYGGVYLSTNNGTSWTSASNGLPSSPNILSLAINSSGYVFAGMGYLSANQGVYLSTDNGTSWNSVGLTNTGYVYSMAFNSSGYIFAGTDSGAYLSTNNGKSWTQVGLHGAHVMSFAINSSGYIFAGTYGSGAYLSTDNGTSWTQVNNGLTNSYVEPLAINSSGYIFAGTWGGGIYRASISSLVTPPSAPTLASPANGSTGVSTNPTLTWNASAGASNYRLQVSTDSTLATTTYDTSGLTTTSKSIGGLSSQTKYYWRVDASGSGGTSGWSAVWNFTTVAAQLSAPTLASPSNGSTGVSTNPTLTWNASTGATSYELQLSTILTFSPTVLDRSNITSTSQGVSGLSRGTTYYWRVNASNSTGSSGWSTVASLTTFTYPSSISVSTQYVPPSVIDSTGYEIIGLPGDIDIPMSSIIPGKQGTDWNAYYDIGANQNYDVEYDGTSTFDFQPGRGFWILSKNPFSVSQTASTVSLDNSNSYSITIHSGWNLISDPFEKSILWSAVQSLNGSSQPIWAFSNGSYSLPSTLDPYSGYYFYNDIGLSFLQIPYVYGSSTASVARLASVADGNLTVAMTDGSKEESSISVGVKSTPGIDAANIFAPPGDFQRARICVVDSTVPAGWKELVKDYRDTIGTGQQFDFYVKNKTGKRLKLSTNVGDGLGQYEVYLIDKDLLRSYNLKDSDQISIPSYNKLKNYSILIGSKSFVDAKLAELLPKGFQLYQNYPNPFNPVTVIRFEIASSEHVSIVIYDVLGRKVKTLMDGNISPGYYEIPFDGTTLASGVYFYRLSAGSFNQVKKMILLK